MLVNQHTFTGEIIDIRRKDSTRALLVKNAMNGKTETKFPVFMDEKVFEALSLNTGDYITVLNAIMFCENNKKRFLVQSPGQVQIGRSQQNEFCYATFSGEITNISEKDNAVMLTLSQNPLDKITEFALVMKKNLFEGLYLVEGDVILVSNALIYQTSEEFRFRIIRSEQLNVFKRNNPDLGVVNAKDKFI